MSSTTLNRALPEIMWSYAPGASVKGQTSFMDWTPLRLLNAMLSSIFVRAVRADLAGLISSHDPGDPAGDWAAFTGRVSSVAFRQDFAGPGEVRLRQVAGDPVIGAITHAVAEIVAAGNWTRLRSCANDECLIVFYDTTRSRTRRWHSYEYCGNRTNVAAYRARNAGV